MDQRIINLFDEYTHAPLSRQDFLKRLALLVGSTTAALALLPLLESNYTQAEVVPVNDPDLKIEEIEYEGDGTRIKGYLAKPVSSGKKGAVIVIHENRGLTPHIKDITRRIAKAGYIALGVDALSGSGGTPANEDDARKLIGELDPKKNLTNYLKGLAFLRTYKESNQKTGAIGFCWGGGLVNQLAVNDPLLNVGVSFYGRQPDTADVAKIKARIQLHYGGLDERINAGIPAYEEALKAAKTNYELYIYEGAQHAFNNDTAPTRYNEAAAKLAWERTLKIFKETLS
jgi:carboxymethylenebutenolidase